MTERDELREQIHTLVAAYYRQAHSAVPFTPGESRVNYAGRVYDERELTAAVDAVLDFWLTAGPRAATFEDGLARFLGLRHALAANSGSSANLVAVSALCSQRLERRLQPGDEVITPAVGFPTTVAPLVQNGLTPVFVDCELGAYNLDPEQLEPALSERTRALFFAHTLGNPVEMDPVMAFARAHNLYVIEDVCDALGSAYDGKMVGAFGDLATLSFYPAHHIPPARVGRSSPVTQSWPASPRACGIGDVIVIAVTIVPLMARAGVASSGGFPAWTSLTITVTCSPRSATTSR